MRHHLPSKRSDAWRSLAPVERRAYRRLSPHFLFLMVAFVFTADGARIGITAEEPDGYLICLYARQLYALSSSMAPTLHEVIKAVHDAHPAHAPSGVPDRRDPTD